MCRFNAVPGLVAVFAATLAAVPTPAAAQDAALSIKREPARVRPVEQFQIPLSLTAARQVTLRAPVDGEVSSVVVQLGQDVGEQGEVARFESELQRLRLKRAEAAAADQPESQSAPVDVEIAKLQLDRTIVRSPIAGRVLAVSVVPGSSVRAADPVATIAALDTLVARVPVQRSSVSVGDSVTLKIESAETTGKVTAILPAGDRLDPLRPLFESLAEAVVEVDNAAGNFVIGQTVYSDLIPREAVVEVPNAAVQTNESGERVVYVIRKNYAVAVPVTTLGGVGETRSYVAGSFGQGDQIVTESSQPLVDGALVVLQAQAGSLGSPGAAPAAGGGGGGSSAPAGYAKTADIYTAPPGKLIVLLPNGRPKLDLEGEPVMVPESQARQNPARQPSGGGGSRPAPTGAAF